MEMQMPTQSLAPGWKECWSNTHKRVYYFHSATGKQSWDPPLVLVPTPTPTPTQSLTQTQTLTQTPTRVQAKGPVFASAPVLEPVSSASASASTSVSRTSVSVSAAASPEIHAQTQATSPTKSQTKSQTHVHANASAHANTNASSDEPLKRKRIDERNCNVYGRETNTAARSEAQAQAGAYDAQDTDLVRAHYNASLRRDSCAGKVVPSREESVVSTLRKLNNFLKAAVIEAHSPYAPWLLNMGSFDVCDIACGKGGDIAKWARAGAHTLIGFDIAELSIADAKARAKSAMSSQMQGGKTVFASCPPRTAFFCADMTRDNLAAILRAQRTPPTPCAFDLVSIQFALHYAFSTAGTAKTALQNVYRLLKPGGACIAIVPDADELVRRFSNTCSPIEIRNDAGQVACSVVPAPSLADDLRRGASFGLRYTFGLADCIDNCPEFLVCSRSLASACAAAGLRVADSINAGAFLSERGVPGFADVSDLSQNNKIQKTMWERTFSVLWGAFGLFASPPSASDRAITTLYRVVRLERAEDDPAFSLAPLLCRSAAGASASEASCSGMFCACHPSLSMPSSMPSMPLSMPLSIPTTCAAFPPVSTISKGTVETVAAEGAERADHAMLAYKKKQEELQRKMEERAAHFSELEKQQQQFHKQPRVQTRVQTRGETHAYAQEPTQTQRQTQRRDDARTLLHHATHVQSAPGTTCPASWNPIK